MLHYGGRDDPKRVTSPKETAALVESKGGTVEIIGHPESGHRIETTDYQLSYYRFFGHHRRSQWPRRVVYRTQHLSEGDGAYWVRIVEAGDSGLPSRIEADLLNSGEVKVATENVSRFTLDFSGATFDGGTPSVIIHGRAAEPQAMEDRRGMYAV
jgi:hypothetical protein